MALNFANVTDVRIPQGDCIRIQETVGGRILWEKKKGKYEIRKNGVTVDWVDIDQLQRKITDGTAQSQYGIGAQLVLYISYAGTEYEYPMNFGTFRTFTKENGQTVNGLGLNAAYAIPNEVVFAYGEGAWTTTGRWKDSLLRAWMNKAGAMSPNATLGNVSHGMIDCFPSDFAEALVPVKVQTSAQTAYASFTVDTTYDKFFLLSIEEMSSYIDASVNSSVYIPPNGTEGTAWEYWSQKLGGSIGHTEYNLNRFIASPSSKNPVDRAWLRSEYEYRYGSNSSNQEMGIGVYMLRWTNNAQGWINGNVNAGMWASIAPACALPGI